MTRFTFLFVALFVLFSLKISVGKPNKKFKNYLSNNDTSQYAIIKFDKSYYWIFKNVTPTSLTVKEVEITEGLLKKAVENYNKDISNTDFAIRPLVEYKRQFVPVINRKGEIEVWVNCFCSENGNQRNGWRNKIIMVDDGGNCYFNLKINLTTKSFYQIAVNGYA